MNPHSRIADRTTRTRDYIGEPLTRTIWICIHKFQFKLHWTRKKPYFNMHKSHINFCGLGGIWCWSSHNRNVYWQTSIPLLEEMDAMCSRPKTKMIIQTVISNKSISQGLPWGGVVSVPLAKVIYTSVMSALMQKSTVFTVCSSLSFQWTVKGDLQWQYLIIPSNTTSHLNHCFYVEWVEENENRPLSSGMTSFSVHTTENEAFQYDLVLFYGYLQIKTEMKVIYLSG